MVGGGPRPPRARVFLRKVERLFSSRPHHGGAWLAGQPSVPAEPGAGAARLLEHRVEGRSLSDLRPDDQFRCTALAGFSDSRILCLQWVVGLGTGPAQAPLSRGCERQQTSMPSGSGLLPGPTLRAPRARWDLGHWVGWTIPVVVQSGAG